MSHDRFGHPMDNEIQPAAMLLLGLVGCGDKTMDSGATPQPAYGVAVETGFIDDDDDGFSEMDGDCDDSDPTVHPEAKETPGDGVDSNCDGEDDT